MFQQKKQICEERRVMKESRVTTKLGFPSSSKAADLCIYVREQAAAHPGKFLPVYLHEEQRGGCRFMVITVQTCHS